MANPLLAFLVAFFAVVSTFAQAQSSERDGGQYPQGKQQAAQIQAKALRYHLYHVRLALAEKLDDILSREGDVGTEPPPRNGNGIDAPATSNMDAGGSGLLNRNSPMDISTRLALVDLISACKRERVDFTSQIQAVAIEMTPDQVADLHKLIRIDDRTFRENIDSKMTKIEMCERQRNAQIQAENRAADRRQLLQAEVMYQSWLDERDERVEGLQGEVDRLRMQVNQEEQSQPFSQ